MIPLRPRSSLLAVLLVAACAPAEEPVAEGERLNLILISLDTCRADRLSCYGAERENTPNLDRMAADSVLFEDCLSQSCVTAPAHMSLLTSHYVHRHGLKKNGLERFPPYTLASVLKDAGWRTGAFTGHGSFQAKYGHGVGFEVFESWTAGPEAWPFTRNLPEVIPGALAWIDQEDDPFFLLLHGYDPHCPYWPEEPARSTYGGWYQGKFKPDRACGPPEYLNLIRRGRVGDDEVRYVNDLYDAEIFQADQAIGGFLDELERRGLLDTSVVVFTSDHGEDLGAKDRIGHGALTPGILSVPLLVRFPDGRHRGVLSDPVELVDLMPTLLSALGVEVPGGIQGRDLMPLIRDRRAPWVGERMRIAQANEKVSLRFGKRWKLDFGLEEGRATDPRLYDLSRDPGELRNLYSQPGGRERFEDLAGRFLEWRSRSASEDASLYSGATGDSTAEDQAMLEALGYTEGGGG
jgi:arylsulfatase A-like enzyme